MAGGNVAGRPATKPFALSFRNQRNGLPEPGTTEHATLILVIVILTVLYVLRRYFRSAHGG